MLPNCKSILRRKKRQEIQKTTWILKSIYFKILKPQFFRFLDDNPLHFVDKKPIKPEYFINLNTKKANANGKHRRMRVPISLYIIENGSIKFKCPHVTLDLFDILIKQNGLNQLEQGMVKCDNCKINIKDYKLLRINQQLYNIIKKVNCRTIYVSQIFDNTFHFYHQKKQQQQIQLIEENQGLLQSCLNKKIQFENVLQQYVTQRGHLLQGKIITLYSLCLYSGLKIGIPVRFDGCTHIELYDFVGVLMMMQYYKGVEFKNQRVPCYHLSCSNMINVIQPEISFDVTIHELIMKSLPYSFIFQQSSDNFKKFQDIKYEIEHFNDFDLIKLYQRELNNDISQKEKNKEQLNIFLKRCHQIMNKDISQELEQKLRYSTYEVDYLDKKYEILTQYPARCNNCPLNKIADLRVFIILYHKFLELKQNNIACPSCGQYVAIKEFSNNIYFDRFLCLYQCQNQLEINKEKRLIYNKDNINLVNQLIKRQQTNLEDQIQRYQKTSVNRYANLSVKQIMAIDQPIGNTRCNNEFKDFQEIKKKIFTNEEFNLFNCQQCKIQNKKLNVQDLYYDSTIRQMVLEKNVPNDDTTFRENSLQVLKQLPLIQPRLSTQGSLESPKKVNQNQQPPSPNTPGTQIQNQQRVVTVIGPNGTVQTMTVQTREQFQQPQNQFFNQNPAQKYQLEQQQQQQPHNPQNQQQQLQPQQQQPYYPQQQQQIIQSSTNSKIKVLSVSKLDPNK
ncbi:hypothetical protein pb186bvf_013493 [Paramecium bursaria]